MFRKKSVLFIPRWADISYVRRGNDKSAFDITLFFRSSCYDKCNNMSMNWCSTRKCSTDSSMYSFFSGWTTQAQSLIIQSSFPLWAAFLMYIAVVVCCARIQEPRIIPASTLSIIFGDILHFSQLSHWIQVYFNCEWTGSLLHKMLCWISTSVLMSAESREWHR